MVGEVTDPYGPTMTFEPAVPIHQSPLEVAPDTFLLRSAQPAAGAPLSVNLNSLLIRAAEPVVVDTGTVANREAWLADLTSLVDPAEVRWVFLSHDDDDHTGNLAQVLEMCPEATLVTSWAATERMGCSFGIPPTRLRWVDDGGTLDVGDRVLRAVRPPVYDSPTTRALFDPATGVLWASDAFATPMTAEPVDAVDELPPPMWAEGFAMFHHHALSPWLSMVERGAYAEQVQRFRSLDPTVIVAAHSPVIAGASIGTAFDHLAALPDVVPAPHPDQAALEQALAGMPS
jgi:flavorubredoxin